MAGTNGCCTLGSPWDSILLTTLVAISTLVLWDSFSHHSLDHQFHTTAGAPFVPRLRPQASRQQDPTLRPWVRPPRRLGSVPTLGITDAPRSPAASTSFDPLTAAASRLFVLGALLSAIFFAKLMDRSQPGLHRPPEVALYAASGERSMVDALSSLLGEATADSVPKAGTPAPAALQVVPKEEVLRQLAALPMGDARQQVAFLNSLGLTKWGAAASRLEYFPVSMQQLERMGLNAFALGIIENDADLDKIKNYTAAVFVIFSVLAVLAGVVFPGPTGATLAYLLGAVPLVFLGIGSTVPGIIVKAISVFEEGKEGTGGNEDAQGVNRRVRHEAAHFLTGYLLGLPLGTYSVEADTSRVEFFATARGDLEPGERLTKEELDKLCVVSLAGTVGEALAFPRAAGGGQDLRILQRAFVTCEERLNPSMQQDRTRWGALKARELLKSYDPEYQRVCQAFAKKLPVGECIAAIESA